MSFTFERLPDEILMIIFQYSGDVYNILRTFLGLNQCLNQILLDKRLHLLTDFLFINARNDYYDSEIFQQVSQQLLSINTTINEDQLCQILQPLISFHIRQKYTELGHEVQSSLVKLTTIRQQFTNDELDKVDHELKIQFDGLLDTSITIETIKRIKTLVLTKGARLECRDNDLYGFNLAQAVNRRIVCHVNNTKSPTSISINSFLQLFKILIISNTSLLNNKDYIIYNGCKLDYFLVYTLYRSCSSKFVNMECYRATVDLFLFALQCRKQMSENDSYMRENICDTLGMISVIDNHLFIRTVQLEILKIFVDEYAVTPNESCDYYSKHTFRRILKQLVKNRRLDVVKYIYRQFQFQELFNEPNHFRECVDMTTSNQVERRFFSAIIEDRSLDWLFPKQYLLFILLDKKERKLLEKILKLSPCLINQLDENGNDPLLYISLKVNGCRHRIIEMLIKMGSDLQRRNFNGQNFMEILQLQRNKKLFQKLIEHEII